MVVVAVAVAVAARHFSVGHSRRYAGRKGASEVCMLVKIISSNRGVNTMWYCCF